VLEVQEADVRGAELHERTDRIYMGGRLADQWRLHGLRIMREDDYESEPFDMTHPPDCPCCYERPWTADEVEAYFSEHRRWERLERLRTIGDLFEKTQAIGPQAAV
jgi:hypothetical protein